MKKFDEIFEQLNDEANNMGFAGLYDVILGNEVIYFFENISESERNKYLFHQVVRGPFKAFIANLSKTDILYNLSEMSDDFFKEELKWFVETYKDELEIDNICEDFDEEILSQYLFKPIEESDLQNIDIGDDFAELIDFKYKANKIFEENNMRYWTLYELLVAYEIKFVIENMFNDQTLLNQLNKLDPDDYNYVFSEWAEYYDLPDLQYLIMEDFQEDIKAILKEKKTLQEDLK